MAIRDTKIKPFIEDRDENVSIGIDLPFRKSDGPDGWFASSSTTIEAVKNNIRYLLQTEQGERYMQPNLGLGLRKYMFEQVNEDTTFKIQNDILDYGYEYPLYGQISKLVSYTPIDFKECSILNVSGFTNLAFFFLS